MEKDDNDDGDYAGPCNTQQETYTYGDNCMLVFPDHDKEVIRTEDTPYSVLVPLVKELASILEGNCSVEELQQYKAMLSNAIAKKKNELVSAMQIHGMQMCKWQGKWYRQVFGPTKSKRHMVPSIWLSIVNVLVFRLSMWDPSKIPLYRLRSWVVETKP